MAAEYVMKSHSGGSTVISTKANGVEIAILILAIVIVVFGGFWMFVAIFRRNNWDNNHGGHGFYPYPPAYLPPFMPYGNVQYSATVPNNKETVVVHVPAQQPYYGNGGHCGAGHHD